MSKPARRETGKQATGAGQARPAAAAGRRPRARNRSRTLGIRRWGLPGAVVVGVLIGLAILAVEGTHPSLGGETGMGGDFKLVAYQGEAILGGHEPTFSNVFRQGKPVVLNFWAGNCPPCRVEMPGFQQVSTEFSGRVIFVGVDVGPFLGLGTHDDAVTLYRQLGIHYPLAYAVDASPLQLYHVQGMPTTVFLTPTGQVADRVTGILTEDQLRGEIQQKLLAGS